MRIQFEYLKISRSRKMKSSLTRVVGAEWDKNIDENELGRQGWELVTIATYANSASNFDSTTSGLTTDEMWVFKRALQKC